MKKLTTNQVIERITDGRLALRHSLTLARTPKQYVIFVGDSIYATDNLERTWTRVLQSMGDTPANQVILINAKEYQQHLLTVK